mgnify:CR=1 FL=1
MKTRHLSYVLGIAAMVAFAYMTSYYPEMLSTFFIAYMGVVLLATLLITGKSASRLVKDLEYVSAGRKIFSAKKDTVNKLKLLDSENLAKELKGQSVLALLYIIPLIVFFAVVFLPGAREGIIGVFRGLFGGFIADEHLLSFMSYLAFYFLFFLFSLCTTLLSRVTYRTLGGMLIVPQKYLVTDRGLILDDRTPLKFPLKDALLKLDERRRFVEITVKSSAQGTGTVRYRLYTRQPQGLYSLLSKMLSEERR